MYLIKLNRLKIIIKSRKMYVKLNTAILKVTIKSMIILQVVHTIKIGAPATCVAFPHVQRILEGVQTHFITRALPIPFFIHNDRKRQRAYLPPIHDRNLYLAKRWCARCYITAGYRTTLTITHTKNAHTPAATIHHSN